MTTFYPESRFGGFTDIDGTIHFYSRVRSLAGSSTTILDFGCGRAEYSEDPIEFRKSLRILRSPGRRVIGMDVDPAGQTNPYIDEFHLLQENRSWPVNAGSVDLVVADWVIEHLPNPDHFFQEAHRCLKTNGHLCLRTTNRISYVGLASYLVPNRMHSAVLLRAQKDRKHEDIFPTLYRCNSVFKMRDQMKQHRFDAVVYGFESEPRYLEFSRLAYLCGVLHQRLAPSVFRPVIFAFGRKIEPKSSNGHPALPG